MHRLSHVTYVVPYYTTSHVTYVVPHTQRVMSHTWCHTTQRVMSHMRCHTHNELCPYMELYEPRTISHIRCYRHNESCVTRRVTHDLVCMRHHICDMTRGVMWHRVCDMTRCVCGTMCVAYLVACVAPLYMRDMKSHVSVAPHMNTT